MLLGLSISRTDLDFAHFHIQDGRQNDWIMLQNACFFLTQIQLWSIQSSNQTAQSETLTFFNEHTIVHCD